jgi:archaellum component FlaF (FlaF/FlaG flagellin family)
VALSESVIEDNVGINYWNTWANTSAADSITISVPAPSATIASSCIVTGTYTGTPPTGIEIQHNAGSWIALTGATISGGAWSGYANGITPATGTLKARYSNSTSVESSGITGVVVNSNAIAINAPVTWKPFQVNASDQASVTISGTYTGSPTNIEYRFAGGSWATLVAGPAGGTYSTSVTLNLGFGDIETRFSNATGVIAVSPYHGIGEVILLGGQSNNQGQATVLQVYTQSNGLRAARFTHPSPQGTAGTWTELIDPCDEYPGTPGGSYTHQLATNYLAAGIPVSFVPCAVGSSGITAWQKGGGTSNYDYALARFVEIGSACRCMFFLQGEADAANSMSTATYQGHLEDMIDDWWADTGTPVVVFRIGEGGISPASKTDAIREAQRIVGSTHPHAILGPDLYGLEPTDIHFIKTPAIQGVGNRTWDVVGPAFVDQMPNQARVRFPQIRVLQTR